MSYDWEWIDGIGIRVGERWAPRGLVELVGVDYFGHVTTANLRWSETVTTDAAIEKLARLTRLQELSLHASSVSDAGLANVKRLTDLVDLSSAPLRSPMLGSRT